MSVRHCRRAASVAVGRTTARRFKYSAIALGVAALLSANAHAQDAAPADSAAVELDTVVVKGVRSSVTKAQLIKQNAEQFVDSIVAEDIGKLPDNNVAEALQRISGIQITRTYGEGSSIAIRGLTQVRTELNGRDIFTANDGRGLSFEDVSAELMAGVDVYKNPSAEMIEGGLGGTVNLRTKMPFDYEGGKFSAGMQYNRYDLVDKGDAAISGLLSQRWNTGIGEIGVLANVSYQNGSFRQDTISIEPFWLQTNVGGREGQDSFMPHGAGINTTFGDRERLTSSLAAQWRPNDTTEVYLQAMRSDYKFRWRDYSYFAYTGGNDITLASWLPSNFTADGEFQGGTFAGVPIDSNTSLTTRHSVTTDVSGGVKWSPNEKLQLSTDFQYVDATTDSSRYIVSTGIWSSPLFSLDLTGGLPAMSIVGWGGETDFLTNKDNYSGWNWHLDNKDDNQAEQFSWRSDLEYAFDSDVLRSFKAGVRYTDRSAINRGNVWRWMGIYKPFADVPGGEVGINPFTDFFRGQGTLLGPTVAATDAMVADYENTLKLFGASPLAFGPNNINTQDETTYAAYGVLRFGNDTARLPFDGNVGVRVVRTEVESTGVMTNPENTSQLLPISVSRSYTSVLPSLNLRFFLADNVQWRFAASQGLSRPGFDKLNPNLSLSTTLDPEGNVINRTGSAGNPGLKPMEATQFDTSLEWYFGQGSMLYGTLFYKSIDGFIANGTFNEVYDGETYQVTRPVNGDDGSIRGFELGYTQFFDFLPGLWSGLGVQANYTYVDSEAPSPSASDTSGNALRVPLEGLSKRSYNLIGMYERGRFSARVAYNWRSDWLVTTAGNGTGNLPIYNNDFGQLDASVRFNFNDIWSISLDGVNLTDTQRETYQGSESRPRDFVLNDRRYGISIRANLDL